MKRNLMRLLVLAVSAFALFAMRSCKDEPAIATAGSVTVDPAEYTAQPDGDEFEFSVTSNAYWDIACKDGDDKTIRWLTPDRTTGNGNVDKISVTVTRNNSDSQRIGYIYITSADGKGKASVKVTQGGSDNPIGGGYKFPICEVFENNAEDTGVANGMLTDKTFIFDDGMVIERVGGVPALSYVPNYNNQVYQRGLNATNWTPGTYWLLTIPVEDAVYGDLRLMYGQRNDTHSNTNKWTVEWSADGNEWNTPSEGITLSGAAEIWRYQMFKIDESKAIPEGGVLYLKVAPPAGVDASITTFLETGICISNQYPDPTALPGMDSETIIFSTGFDELSGAGGDVLLPIFYMSSADGPGHSTLYKETVTTASCYNRPGYIKVGASATPGKYNIKMSRLKDMDIAKTDVEVSFKAGLYMPATNVGAKQGVCVQLTESGGATIEGSGRVADLPYLSHTDPFQERKVTIKNVTPETVITITSEGSGDTRFLLDDILVKAVGTPTRPDPEAPDYTQISDIRSRKPAAGGQTTITDNLYVRGRVVSDRSAGNLPAGLVAVADKDNASANSGIFVKLNTNTLDLGDEVEVTVKNATLSYEDGLLVVIPAADDKVVKTDSPNAVPVAKGVTISDLAGGAYEAMYVELPRSQVIDTDLSKTMSGSVTLETQDEAAYAMVTQAAASFAGQNVPQLSGLVRGIAGAGATVMPRTMDDLSSMTMDRFGGTVTYLTPMVYTFEADRTQAAATLLNAAIAGDKLTFTEGGATIERLNGESDMLFGWANQGAFYNNYIGTTGWNNAGSAWLVTIPSGTQELSGEMRFYFSAYSAVAEMQATWKIDWSNDNVNWYPADKMYTGSMVESSGNSFTMKNTPSAGISYAYFAIPSSRKIPAGSNIYFKIYPADNSGFAAASSGRFGLGCYLASDNIENTVMPAGPNVILAENFSANKLGTDYMAGGLRYLGYTGAPAAKMQEGGWANTRVYERPGYAFCGNSTADGHGVVTPELSAITGTADITITFKACLYMPATLNGATNTITLLVSGGGTITQEIEWETDPTSDYFKWHKATAKIKGATSGTKVAIKSKDGAGDRRFFIDDILITKD